MFIVHVHCSLFMFIVHCSHGATLIFDDVFIIIMGGSTLRKCVGCNECQYIDTSCTRPSLDLEMERVEAMKIRCKDNDRCKTVLLFFHLILHIVLFVLFWRFFGDPSVEKYIAEETIVISSHEKTNGIQAPRVYLNRRRIEVSPRLNN